MLRKLLTMVTFVALASACGFPSPTENGGVDSNNWRYDIEVGITNSQDQHIAVVGDNFIISGSGSHKGTPGIYAADGSTVMPFVDRGPCAAGSPCWTGVLLVPRDGSHEWSIQATIHLTRAAYRQAFDDGGSLKIYCKVLRDGKPLALFEGTGIGYAVTPIQEAGDFHANCFANA